MDSLIGDSQAANVAAAVENPTYLRKSRLEVEDSPSFSPFPRNSSAASSAGNSLLRALFTTSESTNSSIPFQYFLFSAIIVGERFFFINSDIYHTPNLRSSLR